MASFMTLAPALAAGGITDINPGLTLWTGITFLVLLVVLGKFAWGPIVKMLVERERTIRDAIESAKKERAEAERLLAEQKQTLLVAQREASELAKRNAQEVEKLRQELTDRARKEADELVATARRQVAEEITKARAELKAHGGRSRHRRRRPAREGEPRRQGAARPRRGVHRAAPGDPRRLRRGTFVLRLRLASARRSSG